MTIDLKWVLPFLTPFAVLFMLQALSFAAGLHLPPEIAFTLSLLLGAISSTFVACALIDLGPVWPVKIGGRKDGC